MAGISSQLSAQQTRNVAVSDSKGHVQYYDEAKVALGQCPNPNGSSGFDNPTCATSIILAGDTITWTDASGVSGDQHSATQGVCNPICNYFPAVPPAFDIPGGGTNFTGVGQSGSFTFDTSGPGVFPVWCRAHLALMTGAVIVQDYDLTLNNSTLFAYVGTSTAFNNLGTLTGQPQTEPAGTPTGILPVPYNNNVNLSCVASGTNPPNTACTFNPSSPQPGTPVNFSLTANHSSVANLNFNIQGQGTDADLLTHTKNVTLHVVSLAFTSGPSNVTTGANATSGADAFTITTGGTFPNATVGLSCNDGSDPNVSCTFSPGSTFTPSGGAHALSLKVVTTGAA